VSDNPLVPVGPSLFTRSELDAAVKEMIPQLPPGRNHGVGFALDTRGAQFAVLFGNTDGIGVDWQAVGAVRISEHGKVSGAASGVVTW
jgi:hypothetical protein